MSGTDSKRAVHKRRGPPYYSRYVCHSDLSNAHHVKLRLWQIARDMLVQPLSVKLAPVSLSLQPCVNRCRDRHCRNLPYYSPYPAVLAGTDKPFRRPSHTYHGPPTRSTGSVPPGLPVPCVKSVILCSILSIGGRVANWYDRRPAQIFATNPHKTVIITKKKGKKEKKGRAGPFSHLSLKQVSGLVRGPGLATA